MPVFHLRGDSNRLPPVQRARMSIEDPPRRVSERYYILDDKAVAR